MAGHQAVSETGDMLPISIRLRRLPVGITAEAVRTMLLFAQDLQDIEVVPNEYEEDRGFSTAMARFATLSGATEAQMLLDGKASMIVEMLDVPIQGQVFRRSTLSTSASRPATQPTSPRSQPGRYNAQQYDIVKRGSASPPMSALPLTATGGRAGDDGQFLPKSPLSVSSKDGVRVSGKSIINQADSELDSNDQIPPIPTNMNNMDFHGHRTSTIQAPTAGFQRLSLQTEGPRHSYSPGFYAPRSGIQSYSPRQSFPPVQQGGHGHQFGRGPLFPPVNPADQNPPCNTLYVGNLPMDTSEDELKAMFSKQRGYKRLCFRTKQNGPMCFVEFEDVSFATKALSDLYGAQLHNSVKGGIRLSFSKNPLGVRSGQVGNGGALSSPLVMNSPGTTQGMVPMSPGSYHAVNGPPPGLSVPPGFPAAMSATGHYQHSGSLRSIQNTTPLHDIQFHEEYKST